MVRRYAVVLLFALALCALPRPARAMETPASGLVHRLRATETGRRVFAPDFRLKDTTGIAPGAALPESPQARYRAIADAESNASVRLAPFRVGNTWVIATETREEVDLEMAGLDPLMLTPRAVLVDSVLTGLSQQQVRTLGSEEGLAAADLSPALQALLAAALRLPMTLYLIPRPPLMGEGDPAPTEVRALAAPPDIATLRLRARLTVGAHGTVGDRSLGGQAPEGAMALMPSMGGSRDENEPYVNVSALRMVPNTPKPGDLAGERFTMPLGLQGTYKVYQVLERLEKVTGLTFESEDTFEGRRVFIGSALITAGEVLDGLRLAFTAAWRKVGNEYVLCWDVRGMNALQVRVKDRADAALKVGDALRQAAERSLGWLTLARTLPFDTEHRIGLTDAQRERLINGPVAGEDVPRLGWADLTPDQKEVLRQEARLRGVTNPKAMERVIVPLRAQVKLEARLPDAGWVLLSLGSNQSISAWTFRPKQEPKPRQRTLWATERAVLVPPLPPTRVTEVARTMKARGFTTLLYPAFVDGYATFPNTVFPRHPALGGADGWAGAVSAAKANGLNLVGSISLLAWQPSGDAGHWLRKYPEWLDVDATGRPRLAWAETYPEQTRDPLTAVVSRHNWVRPTVPTVRTRLATLAREFARRPGAAKVYFLDTRPDPSYDLWSPNAPPLGMHPSDRVWRLSARGEDPLDRPLRYEPFRPPLWSLWMNQSDEEYNPSSPNVIQNPAPSPARTLLAELTAILKPARPAWSPAWGPNEGRLGRGIPHLISWPEPECDQPPFISYLGDKTDILLEMTQLPDPRSEMGRPGAVILDFRYNPSEIEPTLRWVKGSSG